MTQTPEPEIRAVAYCPACDRPYFGRSRVEAMGVMREHLKKCRPEMLDSTRD